MKGYTIEKGEDTGIALTRDNVLVKDETDMENIEFWEDRLNQLNQPYVTAFRKKKGKIVYSIFTKMRGKGTVFK